jgi:hypothetical protein
MLTIFTTPKPFAGHIEVIQRNAIGSWRQLGDDVEILLIGDEKGMGEIAREYNALHIADVNCNELGTPLVNSIFQIASKVSRYATMCYVNADIILLDDLLTTISLIEAQFQEFLMIGQRWDIDLRNRIAFDENWRHEMNLMLEAKGRLHPPAGSDYFIYKRNTFDQMPSFALGRAGWDNWMIYDGRSRHIPVVDCTGSATVIHQDHDYAHLPDGQPHYRLPESDENVRLSGGQETIFTLSDANWIVQDGQVLRKPWGKRLNRRGIEAGLISTFGPGKISWITRVVLHPVEAFRYYLNALKRRLSDESGQMSGSIGERD